jgi:hypothetical protein
LLRLRLRLLLQRLLLLLLMMLLLLLLLMMLLLRRRRPLSPHPPASVNAPRMCLQHHRSAHTARIWVVPAGLARLAVPKVGLAARQPHPLPRAPQRLNGCHIEIRRRGARVSGLRPRCGSCGVGGRVCCRCCCYAARTRRLK